ncbi:MAG: hypothetical protein KAW45_03960 [Thermoplasmatales archaeon]|nr:hypothetical protein [Thermoplasmatales archaeon]
MIEKSTKNHTIKIAILAEEPLKWGSGKHYFPVILDGYTWKIKDKSYRFETEYIYDTDILDGKLNISTYDVLLIPGGGVGDGLSIVKGFKSFRKVRKWKKNIADFIKNGGGCVGICGGAALITGLSTGIDSKPRTLVERLYNNSSIGISCVKHYYNNLSMPIFSLFQSKYPEQIGAMAYVFSFAPGETENGTYIHSGGVPIDFQLHKDNPIFSDISKDTERIRWWGGPAIFIPKNPDRDVKILARYPKLDLSENKNTKIYAWKYTSGIHGIIRGMFRAAKIIKKENNSLRNLLLYAFFLSGNWKKTEKLIELDLSNKPCMTSEIYPNENKGRIILSTPHPEYMIWWGGNIEEVPDTKNNDMAHGFHKWKNIKPLSKTLADELTYTWWIVRRMTAWAAKIPDDHMPSITKEIIKEKTQEIINDNIYWDGSLIDQMNNI